MWLVGPTPVRQTVIELRQTSALCQTDDSLNGHSRARPGHPRNAARPAVSVDARHKVGHDDFAEIESSERI
jgi:hypothetical protein